MRKWLKKANWLVIAGVVTSAYLAALLWQLGWANVLSFLSPQTAFNEIGDFLAGVFAPVALIWLVAAVFTQRQELNETRDQFEENQKVVDAQLKTINSQNALLALQHHQAQESAKQTYKLSLFGERYKIYEEFVAFGERHHSSQYRRKAHLEMKELTRRASLVFGREIEDWFQQICDVISDNDDLRNRHMIDVGTPYDPKEVMTDEGAEHQISQNEHWLWRQFFLPEERGERFYKFLHISDE